MDPVLPGDSRGARALVDQVSCAPVPWTDLACNATRSRDGRTTINKHTKRLVTGGVGEVTDVHKTKREPNRHEFATRRSR